MVLQDRIRAFSKLGDFFSQFHEKGIEVKDLEENNEFLEPFMLLIKRAKESNPWFDQEQIHFALQSWSQALTKPNLEHWLKNYELNESPGKTVGIIMAGNIPLVGFHDFLSVLITGNKALVKLSSNDDLLMPMIKLFLIRQNEAFKDLIIFEKEHLKGFDAVIATGSDNTARYFEYYFGKVPHIIRQNRNSIAIISGNESLEELKPIGEDIFRYYGLGCRNVSKVYIPRDYDINRLFEAIYPYKDLLSNEKYLNNYDYNKAIYLMSVDSSLLENGFFLMRESTEFSSPIATLFYERYSDENELMQTLDQNRDKIQIILSEQGKIDGSYPFGTAQSPSLSDYADGVNTLDFLVGLA